MASRLAYSNILSVRCQSKSVDDDPRAALAVFVDPLGVALLQTDAPVGKILTEFARNDGLLAPGFVEHRVEVVLVFDPRRVPDGVAVRLSEVRHLAAHLEVAFDGRRGFLTCGALPVILQLPIAFLPLEDTGPVSGAVHRDEVLGFALVVLDLVPHLLAAAALQTGGVVVVVIAIVFDGFVLDVGTVLTVLVADRTCGIDLLAG